MDSNLNGDKEAKSFGELIHDMQAMSMVYKLDNEECSKALDIN